MVKKIKKEIKEILDNSHVGVLPMPKTPIWEIASPIKLVEYARFGLMTVGPKHSGNKWINDQEDLNVGNFSQIVKVGGLKPLRRLKKLSRK